MPLEPDAPLRRDHADLRKRVPSMGFHRALLAAAVLVPATLFFGAAMLRETEVRREATDTVVRTAAILHEHARKVFETHEILLGRIDERLSGLSWDEIAAPKWSEYLATLKAPLPQTVSIWATGPDGVVRAGSDPVPPGGSIAGRDFFDAQAARDRGLYVSKAFVGKVTKTASFAISRRRSAPDGRFDGTIHVSVSPDYFRSFFAEASPGIAASATLFRDDGEVLARYPVDDAPTTLPSDSSLLTAIRNGADGGVLEARLPVDGRPSLVSYRKIEGYPVYVAFGIDNDAINAGWRRDLYGYAMMAAFASLVLLLISWLAEQRAHELRAALADLAREVDERSNIEGRLRQAQKMDAIGQLTGGIAHDFNNILTTIIGSLVAIRRDILPEQKSIEAQALAALASAERAASLTRRLLGFARQQPLSPRTVDVAALVADLLLLIRRSVGENIDVAVETVPDLWPVRCDPNGLENVLINLAVNARDAMPNGGRLTIAVGNITLEGEMPGDYVRISAIDTGMGMSETTLARAFDPFFTTKPMGQGTGLGLSQAYGYAQQSNGLIRLHSAEGQGTRADLYLPRDVTPPAEAPNPVALQTGMPEASRAARILLVEDEPLVRLVMAEALIAAGMIVAEAEDARQALDLVDNGLQLDMLVSDIGLPNGMNGRQLGEAILIKRPGLPVLLATGYARDLFKDGIVDGVEVIEKPFMPEELVARVRVILRQTAEVDGVA